MTIHRTAYTTTICDGYKEQVRKTVDAIREAQARDYLQPIDLCLAVRTTAGAVGAIPAFNHPMYLGRDEHLSQGSDKSHTIDNYERILLAVDLRPACRTERNAGVLGSSENDFRVVNSTMYKMRLYRAALNSLWIQQGPAAIRTITPMAMSVFASWVSETLGRRYGLDPSSQYNLMILAAIFYSSNHYDGLKYDGMTENRQLSAIATGLKVDLNDVLKAYDNTHLILSMGDFCKKVKAYLNNVRLEELDSGILVQLMKGTWFGDNAAENVSVALEHPPTWLTILLEAYTSTAMKNTIITRICERRQYKDGMEQLVRSVKALCPQATEEVAKYR